MTKAINNYDKTKISMAHVFLQYDQATMIHKYSLDYPFLSLVHGIIPDRHQKYPG